jgi:hypothetical protein
MTLKGITTKFPEKRFAGEKGGDSRFFCLIGESPKPTIIEVPTGVTVISEEGHKMGNTGQFPFTTKCTMLRVDYQSSSSLCNLY